MGVSVLRLRECSASDVDRLVGLGGDDGVEALGRRIGPELEGLAERLSRMALAFRDGRFTEVGRGARDVAERAGALGLSRIAGVAHTIEGLSPRLDPNALAANVARLMRLGDTALESIWQLQDAQY